MPSFSHFSIVNKLLSLSPLLEKETDSEEWRERAGAWKLT
jgi:hypothetical protein